MMTLESLTDREAIYDKLGRGPLPLAGWLSPEQYEAEIAAIFNKDWLMVGRVEEIAEPGDFKVKKLEFAQTSVIITRGRDGTIRAFHNLCTHRGNKIIPETGADTFGRARGHVLTCRFHGWVFDTAGDIRMIPHEERFPEKLDRSCLSMRPVQCDQWQGFIFICLEEKPRQTLGEFLGAYGTHFADYPYHEATWRRRYSAVLNCNWKVALDAFAEGYHVETIHAGTLPGIARVKMEHIEFKAFGQHSSSGFYVPGAEAMKPTPVEALLAGKLRGSDRYRPRPDLLPATINPQKRNDFMFEFSVMGPNTVLHLCSGNAYAGMSYFYHQFWPMGPGRTLWQGANFYQPPTTPSELIALTHTDTLHRNAWLEDTSTMENTYEGMMSGRIDQIYLMHDELMIRNSHHSIKEATRG
jgi:nitrite reductase/ring-hydroxylating ferredoxin subunit